MMDFEAKFGQKVEAFAGGQRVSHSLWRENDLKIDVSELGEDFAILSVTEGNLNETHETATYIIFRYVEKRS